MGGELQNRPAKETRKKKSMKKIPGERQCL